MNTEADTAAAHLNVAMGRKMSPDGEVSFDPASHVYTHVRSGRELPSCTRILEATGIRAPYFGDPIYGIRGSWVHSCSEAVDAGDLDWDRAEAEHPDWIGYVRAYELFLSENTVEILSTEEIVWSELWWYAGMCDRTVMLNGRLTRLDLKTGQPDRSQMVQIALYDETQEEEHDLRPLYLRKDGTYRCPPVPEEVQEEARQVAMWAAGITKWRGRK